VGSKNGNNRDTGRWHYSYATDFMQEVKALRTRSSNENKEMGEFNCFYTYNTLFRPLRFAPVFP